MASSREDLMKMLASLMDEARTKYLTAPKSDCAEHSDISFRDSERGEERENSDQDSETEECDELDVDDFEAVVHTLLAEVLALHPESGKRLTTTPLSAKNGQWRKLCMKAVKIDEKKKTEFGGRYKTQLTVVVLSERCFQAAVAVMSSYRKGNLLNQKSTKVNTMLFREVSGLYNEKRIFEEWVNFRDGRSSKEDFNRNLKITKEMDHQPHSQLQSENDQLKSELSVKTSLIKKQEQIIHELKEKVKELEIYPRLTKHPCTTTATAYATVTPIKKDIDNAESDQTKILHVVQQGGSTSYATPVPTALSPAIVLPGISPSSSQSSQSEAGTISFQLMDPVTMEVSTVSLPRACIKLQLVDNSQEGGGIVSKSGDSESFASSASVAIKDEPEDSTDFSTMQSKVVTEFISAKIRKITVNGPSIISLVMHSTDWENLLQLVNEADSSLVHTVVDVKNKVNKTIKLMDNLLPMKASSQATELELEKIEEDDRQSHVSKRQSVLLDPRETPEISQDCLSVINPSSHKSNFSRVTAAANFVKQVSESGTHKRKHSESPDPETLFKKRNVEKELDVACPRWAIGDLVQAKREEVWYEATIVEINEDKSRAKVHFNGLTRRSDKWVTMTKEFLTHAIRCLVKPRRLSKRR